MLYCPSRSPRNASRWLLGGTRRSSSTTAACNCTNFRSTVRWISGGNLRERSRRKMRSASALRKLRIMTNSNEARYYLQVVTAMGASTTPEREKSGTWPRPANGDADDLRPATGRQVGVARGLRRQGLPSDTSGASGPSAGWAAALKRSSPPLFWRTSLPFLPAVDERPPNSYCTNVRVCREDSWTSSSMLPPCSPSC